MAIISSYNTLLTAISDYLARSDLSSGGFVPNFVQQWEERFYRQSDNWASWMETTSAITISSNVAAVPSDYLGLKIAYIDGEVAAPLKRISLNQLYERYPRDANTTGTPRYVSRSGANFEFGPIPSSGTMNATYYQKPTVLRSDGDGTNWLIENAPDLCLYGALLEAEPFIKNDKRITVWKSFYDEALAAYRSRFAAEDFSGSAPHTVVV